MCANVMHKLADGILSTVGIPLLHIVDVTASTLKAAGVRKRLLPATLYTMEQDFYLSRLRDLNGIEAMVPELEDRLAVHDIIFDELCQGIVSHASQRRYLEILIGPQHLDLPTFDSTLLLADAAAEFTLDPASPKWVRAA